MTRVIGGSVIALWRYPVSSLAGERLLSSRLTHAGLELDRAFELFEEETGNIVRALALYAFGIGNACRGMAG
jgi:uncharacterized protein YcbX